MKRRLCSKYLMTLVRSYLVLTLVLSSLMFVSTAYSATVTEAVVRQVAQNFLKRQVENFGPWAGDNNPTVSAIQLVEHEGAPIAYNVSVKPSGYLLIPYYDEFTPVVLYSYTSSFKPERVNESHSMESWILPEMTTSHAALQSLTATGTTTSSTGTKTLAKPAIVDTSIGKSWEFYTTASSATAPSKTVHLATTNTVSQVLPLLTTQWGQAPYYNNMTPAGTGGAVGTCDHTPTGCTATAWAQIMRYWKWPDKGVGSNSYAWNGTTLSADFTQSVYDWNNMPSSLSATSPSAQVDAVARLISDVGIAANMNYGCSGSGAYAVSILSDFFKYKTSRAWHRRNDFTPESWFGLFMSELNATPGRPIFFQSLSTTDIAHAFVADGYQTDGITSKVHVNMGWGGFSDAYYDVYNTFTAGYDWLGSEHTIITGIEPNDPNYFYITNVKSGGYGTNSCASPVYAGSNPVCTITPDAGFRLSALIDNGVDVLSSVSGSAYTISNISADHKVVATFSAINNYTVTPSVVGTGGTITPATPQTVPYRSTSQFSVTPSAGYRIAYVVGTCGGTLNGTSFVTNEIYSDCTVEASFMPIITNGVCGTANGGILSVAPVVNLCNSGTPSSVTGTGPWNWSCLSDDGGIAAYCNAYLPGQSALHLPMTGQTGCWDASGVSIPCSGTGQDGEFRAGVVWPNPRFSDNGDQTVTDKLTGLEWTKDANLMKTRDLSISADGTVNWQQALDYIKKLNNENYLGYNDWRLPNINELESLVNQQQSSTFAWLSAQGFSNVQANVYWSSTTYANLSYIAWYVSMDGGSVNLNYKANGNYVWPVRGGQSGPLGSLTISKTGQTTCYDTLGAPISCTATGQDGELQVGAPWPLPRFTSNAGQTVTDNLTGLIWSKDGNPAAGTKTWQEALDYINNLNSSSYLGHNDWHLPNRNELKSLVNQQQSSTFTWLNTQGFSNVQANFYWSSTTDAYSTYFAWSVHMGYGYVDNYNKTINYYVWPVRGGQSGTLGTLALSPATVSFPATISGTQSVPVTVVLGNGGTTDVAISAATITGTDSTQFSVSPGGSIPCSSLTPTLAPGSSCTLSVLFAPTSSGAKNATLQITSNDAVHPTIQSVLTGTTPITKPGDCDSSGVVSVAEVQSAINMYLKLKPVAGCVDLDSNGTVSVSEVQKTINAYLKLL